MDLSTSIGDGHSAMPAGTGATTLSVMGARVLYCGVRMHHLFLDVQRIAASNASVLINGESGSGKELVARALHCYSVRSEQPWVDLNCAALPDHLIESELFGYERGAFSGADATKAGMFELAHRGTIFLDEIAEMDLKTQVKLLRVLDGAPYYRLGGTRKVAVDVRVIAATNHDLSKVVQAGRFRPDLYHRLNQVSLRVPPLREHPEDIGLLASEFLRAEDPGLSLSEDALAILERYSWPGNVRELRNVMIAAAIFAQNSSIRPWDLPENVTSTSNGNARPADCGHERLRLDGMERETIFKALAAARGSQDKAAELLGISRRTLTRKLKMYAAQEDGNAPDLEGSMECQ